MPIRFIFGLALVISVKQVPKVLGIEAEEGDLFERLWDILRHLGDAHGSTVVIGSGTVALMLALERWVERVPAALVALIVGIGIGEAFDVASEDVEIVREIPPGLGAANVGAGLFHGFPIGSSLSKSAANDRAGANTPVSLLVAADLPAAVALFFTGLFENLPEATRSRSSCCSARWSGGQRHGHP